MVTGSPISIEFDRVEYQNTNFENYYTLLIILTFDQQCTVTCDVL